MMSEKNRLRVEVLTARRSLSAAEAALRSAAIAQHVLSLEEFREAAGVVSYVSSKHNEVDTLGILAAALGGGKPVWVPVTRLDGEPAFSRLISIGDLVRGRWNILEPRVEAQCVELPAAGSVVLVPGIVFGRDGHRIGYGSGYFDRFLSRFDATSVGLAYGFQVVERIPFEVHDEPLDVIVTEEGVV